MKKKCSKCKKTKELSEFNKNKYSKDGLQSSCRECRKKAQAKYRRSDSGKAKIKEHYQANIVEERKRMRNRKFDEKYRDYQRNYRERNKEKIRQSKRNWDKKNVTFHKIRNHNYFAEKKGLKVEWNEDAYEKMLDKFGRKCCLSNETENLNVDHFIAIETGHGGTYQGNMIPLSEKLNQSKSNKNPFEWIKEQTFNVKENFNNVVKELAELNGLDVIEFKSFVYWCYENKRSEEQIKEEQANSLELWKIK